MPLLSVLNGETVIPPPVWLMRQAGRYLPEYREMRAKARDFLELCLTPDLAVELTLQPVRRYRFDAAILFADILLVPHALGQALDYREGEGPVLEPVRSASEVARLDGAKLEARLAPVFESVRRLRAELPPEVALIGFAGAPWTVATYMVEGGSSRDHGTVKRWAYGDAAGFGTLVELLVEATVAYLVGQVKAGADALQLFDTWAGVLSEPGFERWCVGPTHEIVRRVHEACPGVPIVGFPRGAGALYGAYAEGTGLAAIGLYSSVPVGWARRALQARWPVQGNLDPSLLVVGGEPMRAEAARILAALAEGPFVFNLGHGVLPETPLDHVAELVSIVRAWRR